jgi:hypothetical protein
MTELKATLVHERETPGTHRYREIDKNGHPVEQREAIVGTVYIRKHLITGKAPTHITVTVKLD